MNELKISCGFFLLALMLFYLNYEVKQIKEEEKNDSKWISLNIPIFAGIVGLIITSMVLIYSGIYNKPVGLKWLDQYDVLPDFHGSLYEIMF